MSGDSLRQPVGQCRCQEMVARRYDTLQTTIRSGGTSTDRCGSQVSKERGAAGTPGLGARQTSNPATSAPSGAGGGKGTRTRNQARTRKDSKDGKACKSTGTNLKGGEGSGSRRRVCWMHRVTVSQSSASQSRARHGCKESLRHQLENS